uniref:Kruppel like factor 8 n=1 Tax=Paramormyrops kingsleyae TaxID=1676925 RepID=A0A3B3S883_9TELE
YRALTHLNTCTPPPPGFLGHGAAGESIPALCVLLISLSHRVPPPTQKPEACEDSPSPAVPKPKGPAPSESASPPPLCTAKPSAPEILSVDQTEPVDLSLNKPRSNLPPVTAPSSSPAGAATAGAQAVTTTPIPAVLSPGSILASTQGVGGQQILHVIHTIPSVNMPSKMGQLQTIPVVVQSLPVVYTTVPSDGMAAAAITVPLIGSDGRSEGSVRIKPGSASPVEFQSDSDAESGTESGSASFTVVAGVILGPAAPLGGQRAPCEILAATGASQLAATRSTCGGRQRIQAEAQQATWRSG